MSVLQVLIGSLRFCVCCDWPDVVTWVLVVRQSLESHSNYINDPDSQVNKYQLMAKSRLRNRTEAVKLLSNMTYPNLPHASAIAFGVLVSVRASF